MRKERRHGRSEGKRGGGSSSDRAGEGRSTGAMVRSKGGAWEEGRSGGSETSREILRRTPASKQYTVCIQYTAHTTTHNAAKSVDGYTVNCDAS